MKTLLLNWRQRSRAAERDPRIKWVYLFEVVLGLCCLTLYSFWLATDIAVDAPVEALLANTLVVVAMLFNTRIGWQRWRRATATNHIINAPGFGLHRLAEFLCSARTFKHIVEPVIADMQHEHIEALRAGRWVKARWIQWRGYGSFWVTVFLQLPISLGRLMLALWKVS